MAERFITVLEAAELLQVHPQTVRLWIRDGKLQGRLIGGKKSGYRIPVSEIDRLMAPQQLDVSGDQRQPRLPGVADDAKKLAA